MTGVYEKVTLRIMKWKTVLIMLITLTACDDRVEIIFPNYTSIPEQSGAWTWLPVFFPHSATDIEMIFSLDTNLFYADFTLSEPEDRVRFEVALTGAVTGNYPANPLSGWCRQAKTIWNSEAEATLFYISRLSAVRYHVTNDQRNCAKE